jgi:hypothetical protein
LKLYQNAVVKEYLTTASDGKKDKTKYDNLDVISVYWQYISKDIQQIGDALLESLIKNGSIQTEYSRLHVIASVDQFGSIYCHLDGGTTYEKSTFIKSLHEIVGTINNPRYIIIRKSTFLKLLSSEFEDKTERINKWFRFAGRSKADET